MVEVPREVCEERRHKECFPDFEWEEIVINLFTYICLQHCWGHAVHHPVWEHRPARVWGALQGGITNTSTASPTVIHYKVAVPKPVVFPVPIFAPTPTQPPILPPPTYHPGVKRAKRQLAISDPALLTRQVKQATVLPPQPAVSHQVSLFIS